jgi:hypothetical protein
VSIAGAKSISRKLLLKRGKLDCVATVNGRGKLRCSVLASSRLHLAGLKPIASGSRSSAGPGNLKVVVKLPKKALRKLRRLRKFTLVERVSFRDGSGDTTSAQRKLQVR